jgi:hypothetical protein
MNVVDDVNINTNTDEETSTANTAIKKSNKVASVSGSTSAPAAWIPNEIIDNLTINDMIHDIEMLDEEAHEQIYLLLRGFKPCSFFTTDRGGGGTHFDRTLLTERQTSELYRVVQLCKENMARKHVLLTAKQQMEQDTNMAMLRMNVQNAASESD